NDHYSHHHGPEATVESIAKADAAFATFAEAAGGLDEFLETHAVILLADHSQTEVHRGLPLAELLGAEWSVLQPSEERPERAQLAVSPTGRAAHVYLLAGEGEPAEPAAVAARLSVIEGVDLVCWLETADGAPLVRETPGPPSGGDEWAVVERGDTAVRFRPGGEVRDLRGGSWEVEGDLEALEASVSEGQLSSETYPDPLARVWSALAAPHAGDFVVSLAPGFEAVDWGGVSHAGGGSHGALHAGDSLGPLLFVGCGPESADEREQWALRDVAPVIRQHFGVRDG
ncbi:MAG TPA: alkaline phosphatase family protein, partial [Solirubrobacterales bacterium]|nr:alkaline phosphatase family protein [Solirubrobacterales bacterium]